MTSPVALTIAGSDPSGGAGLQADLKTFHRHGVYGCSVVTLLTVQNTCGVTDVLSLDAEFVASQFESVVSDLPPAAAKTGALGSAATIQQVAQCLASCTFPVVVDPVMISKHGHRLMDEDAVAAMKASLFPLATIITPNRFEASQLTSIEVVDLATMTEAAKTLQARGPKYVLVKGGPGIPDACDVLVGDGTLVELRGEVIDTDRTHGSGCVMSAAITANLAKQMDVPEAVVAAKTMVTQAIRTAPKLGKGISPLNLL